MDDVFIVDAGNTAIKLAHFVDDKLVTTHICEKIDAIKQIISPSKKIALSSVKSDAFNKEFMEFFPETFLLSTKMNLPFALDYETPETLGIDRLCNVAALAKLFPKKNALSIDIGTCIKFDLINQEMHYLGGSISPGLRLRFNALHQFTAKLPLLDASEKFDLIGKNTTDAIRSGVQFGMFSEIKAMIERYESSFKDLTIIVTGGDKHYFDFGQKNNIFADENLTLRGIYELYKFNAIHT